MTSVAIRLVCLSIIMLMSMTVGVSAFEEYLQDYRINTQLNPDNVVITHAYRVVNKLNEPLVPGRAKLLLFNEIEAKNAVATVGGSTRRLGDSYKEGDKSIIEYDIWQPILPNEPLDVSVTFETTSIDRKGFLFKEFNMEFLNSEVPISGLEYTVTIPKGHNLIYTNQPILSKEGQHVTFKFTNLEENERVSLDVEYSMLPLPVLPFHGYWLWTLIFVMTFSGVVFNTFKSRKGSPTVAAA